jgi:hypothetical protein
MSVEVPRGGAQTRNLNNCINVLHIYTRLGLREQVHFFVVC